MTDWYRAIGPALRLLPPEVAHRLAIRALAAGLVTMPIVPRGPAVLASRVWGLDFANPIGLAAGFDKDAEAIDGLFGLGFGFVEVGTVTPKPQPGNPKPRLFRLVEDAALINRLGFNGGGLEAMLPRLDARQPDSGRRGILGVNIGKNATSRDAVDDYRRCLEALYRHADYITVNVSSPNTPGLRELQGRAALSRLVETLVATRDRLAAGADADAGDRPRPLRVPLLVKVAPDLEAGDIDDIAAVALDGAVDGLIIGNTTVRRDGLASPLRGESGGLSGPPLLAPSTAVLAAFYHRTEGRIPLVGVGGVASGADAYAKIRAGASLVQLYTGLIYHGPGLVGRIASDLAARLAADGFERIADAVGADAERVS